MFEQIHLWSMASGLGLGMAFGAAAQRSRFCTLAAVCNLSLMRDARQWHAYLAALGVAVTGTAALESSHLVAIAETSYRSPAINWLGALGGGLVFGVGATLAGGCATRTLVRTAEGNIASLVTLLAFAVSSLMSLYGALEPLRRWVAEQSLHLSVSEASLSALFHWPPWLGPLVIGGACLLAIRMGGAWREHKRPIVGGALIGLLVVAGWWITGRLILDEFNPTPPASLAVAGPLAQDALWLFTGQSNGGVFALSLAPGIFLGAFLTALVAGEFHWVAPAGQRVAAYLRGGVLMGVGAQFAGGCNVGQGLTGVSTLSITSLLATLAMFCGMILALAWMQQRSG